MVAAVCDVYIAVPVYGYASRTVEFSDIIAARAYGPDVLAVGVELLQPVVAPVGDVDGSVVRIDTDAPWVVELTVMGTELAESR